MPKHRNLVNVIGAAEYLATSERHVRSLVAQRKIPHHHCGRLLRFDLADLDAWLDANRVDVAS